MTAIEKEIIKITIMCDRSLFDELGDTMAEAVAATLKRQAVQEFFSESEVCCPHCSQHIESTELLQDSEQGATIKKHSENLASTSPTPSDLEELKEVKNLLVKAKSWSDREVEHLPPVARKKAQQYRGTYAGLVGSE